MNQVTENITWIEQRNGGFEGYCVSGNLYENENGQNFWTITVVSDSTEEVNQHCLVSPDGFHCIEAGISFPDFRVISGRTATFDAGLKDKLTALIHEWECADKAA